MGVKHKIKKGAAVGKIGIGEAFEEFAAEKEARNLSASTLRNYRQSYEYFLDFNGLTEENTLEEVEQKHFYKWANSMKIDGVKHTSINHYLRDVRAFFYWCMDEDREYIKDSFKIRLVEGQEEQLKLFEDEDIEALLVKPTRNDSFVTWRTWAIVNWVLATGNRAATICDVKVTDIDYKRKEIRLGHTKNKKAQIVGLSPSLEAVLKEYTRAFNITYWLFPNVGEEQLTTNALAHSFQKYCKDRGVSRTNIHGLRHNFAKYWIKNGGGMPALQNILGHSTLDMTRRYVRLFTEDIKEDFERYNPLDTLKRKSKRTLKITKGE